MWLLLAPAWAAGLDGLPFVQGSEPDSPPDIVQPVGDLDGDNLGDLVIGAPYDDENGDTSGAVWILYAEDVLAMDGVTPLADLGVKLWGNETQDRAGADVAPLGDSDNDGYADVLVGAPDATTGQVQTGKAYLIYGQSTRYEDQPIDDEPAMVGVDNSLRVGSRVYGAGDLDLDGNDDLLLGVPFANPAGDPAAGWLGVMFGRTVRIPDNTHIAMTLTASEQETQCDEAIVINQPISLAGWSAATVPDQDGDGLPEILVGSPGMDAGIDTRGLEENIGTIEPPGAAYLFPGRTREEMAAAPVLLEGNAIGIVAGNYATSSLPGRIATLADGRVAFGVPQANNQAGSVLLYDSLLGEHTEDDADVRWNGASSSDQAGWGLAPAHGLAGGLLAIGEPGYDGGRGRVRIVDEEGELLTLEGCVRGDLAGYTVRSHPGPDPEGDDQGWIGIAAPGRAYYDSGDGFGYGYGYVVTADALGALSDGPCAGGDVVPVTDADGDGYAAAEDCDDTVGWRHPYAPEVCGDGVDDDCDGVADQSCGPVEGRPGCATTGGAAGVALVLAGLVSAGRRRR